MIDVELGTDILDHPKATYELGLSGPMTSIMVQGYDEDTYEDVFHALCRALALVGFRGEVRPIYDGMADGEEKEEILAAMDRLKGTVQITDEDAKRVAAEEARHAEAVDARYKKMLSTIQQEGLRRGLPKEEREKLTLKDALEPQDPK